MRSILIVFFLSLTVVSACNKRAEKLAAPDASAGTYFSIIQFADDQFRTYWGQPFSLVRVENRNGKTDSTILGANQIDWAGELKPFFNADISDPAFLEAVVGRCPGLPRPLSVLHFRGRHYRFPDLLL